MCIRDRVILNAFDITLTLPGLAGIILGIGMAVDANVIIFARVKEEMSKGRSVRNSLKEGFHKAMSAIVDGNVTTLIAAAVLWLKGSGSVKGFALSLIHISMNSNLEKKGCGECQTSCQSACKTSCTVGNQTCEQSK